MIDVNDQTVSIDGNCLPEVAEWVLEAWEASDRISNANDLEQKKKTSLCSNNKVSCAKDDDKSTLDSFREHAEHARTRTTHHVGQVFGRWAARW